MRPRPGGPERLWARHFQDDWQARAGDPRLPRWLRVAALAYGSHSDNGHARFKRGEVAIVLGSVNQTTGEVQPFANVGREIDRAIEYGWLAEGSYWACLIVPAHSVLKGHFGTRPAPCPLVRSHSAKTTKPSLSEPYRSLESTRTEPFAS